MSTSHRLFAAARRSPWVVWVLACGVYVMSMMHRMALGVAGPLALDRLGVSAAQLGSFVTLQLGTYAIMQVPWGLAIDRWGPRRVLLSATALIGVAELAFAFATSYPVALVARALLGVGDSAVFIALLRVVALWFAPRRFAVMAMLTGLFGTAGNLLATTPLALAFTEWGWVRTLAVSAALSLLYAIVFVRPAGPAPFRERPTQQAAATSGLSLGALWEQVRLAWQVPEQRLAFWAHAATMGGATAFSALWAFPYMTEGLGISGPAAASALTVYVLALLGTSLVLGPVTGRRRGTRAPITLATAAAGTLAWAVMLGWPGGHVPYLVVVLVTAVLAVGASSSQIGFQIARDHSAPERNALATGIVNVGGFFTAMIGSVLVGVVLDLRSPGGDPALVDYRWALVVLATASVLSTAQLLRWLLRCRRRALRLLAQGEQVPVPPVAHWWDIGYDRAAVIRSNRRAATAKGPGEPS